MMPTHYPTLAKWSVQDYHRIIETGILNERQVELLAGDIFEMSPEGPLQTVYGKGLAYYLRQHLPSDAWIREARPITLSDSEPEPDIAIVKAPWFQYSQHHPYPQDIFWLIEVSDTTLVKDLTVKPKIYGKAGIAEYWVLDINARKVILFREPYSQGYHQQLEIREGEVISLAFPEVRIPLQKLFSGKIFD